jgi:hypothetical protein
MEKKQIVIAIGAILIVSGLIYLAAQSSVSPQSSPVEQSLQKEDQRPKMSPFILGKVTKVEGEKVSLVIGEEPKTALVNENTQFVIQVKDGDSFKINDAKLSDVKAGQQIVVYYAANNVGNEYPADKIQILPFK